ncbi:MAG: hypothetical protein ACYSWZ_02685 [Planctomycetota bacterium]|jgi:hypothetical protein
MEENFQGSVEADQSAKTATKEKMPVIGHILCGWPLLLVAIGGAIGGGLGGGAYAINVGIYKSQLPIPAKVVLNIIVGSAAIVIWYSIAIALRS